MLRKINSHLVLKTDLGRVKPGFHILPGKHHTYGKSPIPDKYDARTGIISSLPKSLITGKNTKIQKCKHQASTTYLPTSKESKVDALKLK